MAGEAVQNNLVLIIVPLFALLALAIMFVVIPIFAGMVGAGSASQGLVSMSNTLASFSPIYGIGLAIGMLVTHRGLLPGGPSVFRSCGMETSSIRRGCAICRPLNALMCAHS